MHQPSKKAGPARGVHGSVQLGFRVKQKAKPIPSVLFIQGRKPSRLEGETGPKRPNKSRINPLCLAPSRIN